MNSWNVTTNVTSVTNDVDMRDADDTKKFTGDPTQIGNFTGMRIEIYCDGSFRKGKSGIGLAIYLDGNLHMEFSSATKETTNNRTEIIAVYSALLTAHIHYSRVPNVMIYSDSEYTINSVTKWYDGWVTRGERKANMDILDPVVKLYKEMCLKRNVVITWVKGHSGILGNEKVDKLAKKHTYDI